MITKAVIIQQIVSDSKYMQACQAISKGSELSGDLYQELILVMCQMGEEQIVKLHKENELTQYMIGTISMLWLKARSSFNKKYRPKDGTYRIGNCDDPASTDQMLNGWRIRYNSFGFFSPADINPGYNQALDDAIEGVNEILEKMEGEGRHNWYAAKVYKAYIKEGSIRKLAGKTRIPKNNIWQCVKEVNDRFRREIKIEKDNF